MHSDDLSILDIDECKGSPCHVNGRCSNNPGSFECECNVGYSGNGFACTGSVQAVNVSLFLNLVITYADSLDTSDRCMLISNMHWNGCSGVFDIKQRITSIETTD